MGGERREVFGEVVDKIDAVRLFDGGEVDMKVAHQLMDDFAAYVVVGVARDAAVHG